MQNSSNYLCIREIKQSFERSETNGFTKEYVAKTAENIEHQFSDGRNWQLGTKMP